MSLAEKTGHPSELLVHFRLVARFPVTLACAVVFSAIVIASTHEFYTNTPFIREYWSELYFALLLLFFLVPAALAVDLFSESRGWAIQRRILLTGLAIVLCALIVEANWKNVDWGVIVFGSAGLLILATLAPSLRPGVTNRAFWSVTRKTLTGVAFGVLTAVVITVGAKIGLALVDELFKVSAPRAIKQDFWMISLALISPFLVLLRMPDVSGAPETEDAPGWLLFTFNRLLAPLAVIAAALFLAFAAITAVQWKPPSHSLTLMFIAAAGAGVTIWLAFFPFQDQGSRALRLYQRTFPYALLALAALPAAVAVARIADADVIEQRLYRELLLSLTIGAVAVYLLAARAPRLIVPPLAIAVVMIAGSFGPWGAPAVNLGSRIGQVESLLVETGYLVDGRIVQEGGKVDPATSRRLGSMIWKIRKIGRSGELAEWLAETGVTIDTETNTIEILERMGIKYVAVWEEDGSFSFALEEQLLDDGRLLDPLDVAGYDVFTHVDFGGDESAGEIVFAARHQTYVATVADLTIHIARIEDPANGVKLDIRQIVEPLLEAQTAEYTEAPPDQMTVEAQNNGLRVRFIIQELEGAKIDGVIQTSVGQGVLMVGRAE